MKVLVTGSDGYIGARLVPRLIAAGHDVTGYDTGYYRDGWLYSEQSAMQRLATTINKDLRLVAEEDLHGIDAIVHLAELSNDPLGQNDPAVTYGINHLGTRQLAEMARSAGVQRFVYASSCSVYGLGTEDWVNESSPTNPQTAYARCKELVEKDLHTLAGPGFCVTMLRNATAYGPSPRMRFDIVLNDLCALAWTTRRIAMTSDGTPWRPVVHIEDICFAVQCTLTADARQVNGEVFNVGADSENYRVRELADIVAHVVPGCEVTTGSSAGDNRSYRVSFKKIARQLPGFECHWTAGAGAKQLVDLFRRIELSPETYSFRAFTRLKQLKYLIGTSQVNQELYWRY